MRLKVRFALNQKLRPLDLGGFGRFGLEASSCGHHSNENSSQGCEFQTNLSMLVGIGRRL